MNSCIWILDSIFTQEFLSGVLDTSRGIETLTEWNSPGANQFNSIWISLNEFMYFNFAFNFRSRARVRSFWHVTRDRDSDRIEIARCTLFQFNSIWISLDEFISFKARVKFHSRARVRIFWHGTRDRDSCRVEIAWCNFIST